MLLSANELFSYTQEITVHAPSTNIIDLGATKKPRYGATNLKRDIGIGSNVDFFAVLTADATGTDPTLTVQIQVSDTTDFASAITIGQAAFLATTKNTRLSISNIPDFADKRYLRLNYVVGGTDPVFRVSAGICAGVQSN